VHNRFRSIVAACALVPLVALAACGDDDDSTASTGTTADAGAAVTTTAAPTTTTAAPTTTTAAPTTTVASGGSFAPGSDEAEAADAYEIVFDSATTYEEKAPHLADADALRETIEKYTAAAAAFNGFRMDVTAVTVTGDTAAVTYDLYFGTTKQYGDLPGKLDRQSGTWAVSRDEFCGFMASARVPCA
jgi:iron complex transport system substrate-binding protein